MRLRDCLFLPSAVSIGIAISSICHAAAAVPAAPAIKAVSAEAEAVDAELQQVMKERQQQWTAETVEALLQLGTPDDIAVAALVSPMTDRIALARCESDGTCEQLSEEPPWEDDAHDLAIKALEDADQLSADLLRTLLGQNLSKLEAERQDQLVELLIERAPEDVYSWLVKLRLLIERKAPADELTSVLNQAAASVRGASDWFLENARRVDAAYALVPPPPEMLAAVRELIATQTAADIAEHPDDFRRVLAFGVAMAIATPGYGRLSALCRVDERFDPARRSACASITKLLATGSQSVLDRGIGLALWHPLVEGTPQEAVVISLKRKHYWQSEMRTFTEPYDFATDLKYVARALEQHDSNELELLESALREAGVSAEPPPQWMPKNPEVLSARR